MGEVVESVIPSTRLFLAAFAMQGMLACPDFMNELLRTKQVHSRDDARRELARLALAQADALIAEIGADEKGGQG